MAEQTTNLRLAKPDAAEGYDINVFNTNADILDGAVGAVLNALGGTGGGLGDKVDALQESMTAARSEISAVKTDTEALAQALATANANIATLLTQTRGVKQIYREFVTFTDVMQVKRNVPSNMDVARIIILTSDSGNQYNVMWRLSGREITFDGYLNQSFSYQIVEFY
jgi:hypothetical protein